MMTGGRKALLGAVSALALVALSANAEANVITGSLWINETAAASNATLANIPVRAPDVTFSVNSPLNFDSRTATNGYTVGGWLATGGATILTGGGLAGHTMDNSVVEFTGLVSVTTGETFKVAHDDGLTLKIGTDTVVNHPLPTAPTTTTDTYTGASGNMPFTLFYGECCTAPSVLKVSLPLSAPEPGSLAILGTGLLALGAGATWRSRRKTL